MKKIAISLVAICLLATENSFSRVDDSYVMNPQYLVSDNLKAFEFGAEWLYRIFWLRDGDGQEYAVLANIFNQSIKKWFPLAVFSKFENETVGSVAVYSMKEGLLTHCSLKGKLEVPFDFKKTDSSKCQLDFRGNLNEGAIEAKWQTGSLHLEYRSENSFVALFDETNPHNGWVYNGRFGWAAYYTNPSLLTQGQIQIGSESLQSVTGHGWTDRQWESGNFIKALMQKFTWRWTVFKVTEKKTHRLVRAYLGYTIFSPSDPSVIYKKYFVQFDGVGQVAVGPSEGFQVTPTSTVPHGKFQIENKWNIQLPGLPAFSALFEGPVPALEGELMGWKSMIVEGPLKMDTSSLPDSENLDYSGWFEMHSSESRRRAEK